MIHREKNFILEYNRHQINTLRSRKDGSYFVDDIFKSISWIKSICISIDILLKFVPKGPINHIPALVQIMAWCWPGDKPLFKPMMVRLQTHMCVTQWINSVDVAISHEILADILSNTVWQEKHVQNSFMLKKQRRKKGLINSVVSTVTKGVHCEVLGHLQTW